MEVNKNTDAGISRRGVFCGLALLAVGLTTETANAAANAVGVTQVGNKLKLDLTNARHLVGHSLVSNESRERLTGVIGYIESLLEQIYQE